MRLVFLGTPLFAVPSLQALAAAGHRITAVMTQPDRPKGRGQKLSASPVKEAALALGLRVEQPERVRRPEAVGLLTSWQPELMVVVGYGQIIPQSIIDIPPHGILNVHASLLPKYRGAAPIQWAIANQEVETGVTIMRIDAGLDTGDMIHKARTTIGARETAPELSERLAGEGAQLLIAAIQDIENGRAGWQRQNNAEATLAPILKKEDGAVDWSLEASRIDARRRGFTPWPGAFSGFRGQTLRLLDTWPAAGAEELATGLAPGELAVVGRTLLAGCGRGTALEIKSVQAAGRNAMSAEAFLNGYRPKPGECLTHAELSQ